MTGCNVPEGSPSANLVGRLPLKRKNPFEERKDGHKIRETLNQTVEGHGVCGSSADVILTSEYNSSERQYSMTASVPNSQPASPVNATPDSSPNGKEGVAYNQTTAPLVNQLNHIPESKQDTHENSCIDTDTTAFPIMTTPQHDNNHSKPKHNESCQPDDNKPKDKAENNASPKPKTTTPRLENTEPDHSTTRSQERQVALGPQPQPQPEPITANPPNPDLNTDTDTHVTNVSKADGCGHEGTEQTAENTITISDDEDAFPKDNTKKSPKSESNLDEDEEADKNAVYRSQFPATNRGSWPNPQAPHRGFRPDELLYEKGPCGEAVFVATNETEIDEEGSEVDYDGGFYDEWDRDEEEMGGKEMKARQLTIEDIMREVSGDSSDSE